MIESVHRFFEQLLAFYYRPENISSWSEWDFDNFKFIIHELFLYLVAILIKAERFQLASYLMDNEYFCERPDHYGDSMHPYLSFRDHLRSLQYRNDRMKLGRLSLRADLLKERNQGAGLDFKYLMAADFILYLRSHSIDRRFKWWPETLLYVGHFGAPFEVFARAKSKRYFDKVKPLLHVGDKEEVGQLLNKINSEPDRIPGWDYSRLNPKVLLGYDALATIP